MHDSVAQIVYNINCKIDLRKQKLQNTLGEKPVQVNLKLRKECSLLKLQHGCEDFYLALSRPFLTILQFSV